MQYRDKTGQRQRESTGTEDWNEAQRVLRERLEARDNNTLPSLRRGQEITFGEWADSYLVNFSTPPFREYASAVLDTRTQDWSPEMRAAVLAECHNVCVEMGQ